MNTRSAYLYDAETGSYISQEHQRIAELIHEYNPLLSLVWIPYSKRTAQDTKPFAIVHEHGYTVMYLSESEMDHRVLERLYMGDTTKHDVLGRLEASERAQMALQRKRAQDQMDEARELTAAIIKSPLSVYRHNGVEYRD